MLKLTYNLGEWKRKEGRTMEQKMNEASKKNINWKFWVLLGITVLINGAATVILSLGVDGDLFMGVLFLVIFLDIFLIMGMISVYSESGRERETSLDAYASLLEGMDYLEPSHEEIYFEKVDEVATEAEEEETVKILRPKAIIAKESVFREPVMEDYCNSLQEYMAEWGLRIDRSAAREIFSCLAATKLNILRGEHRNISKYFLDVFGGYIGAHSYNENLQEKPLSASEAFWKCLRSAAANAHIIHFMILETENLIPGDELFLHLIAYATDPLLPCYFKGLTQMGLNELPQNIWFFLVPKEADEIPKELMDCSSIMQIDAKVTEPQETVYQNEDKLSNQHLLEIIRDSAETHYVSEELWKKIDELEEYVGSRSSFALDNRVFRQLERYTSMYILCGGEEQQAVDCVLSSKILPAIAGLALPRKPEEGDGIFALCERLFGLENLTKSRVLLKQIEEKNVET
jgi:hypothetical protein